jgi:hypothetical protein
MKEKEKELVEEEILAVETTVSEDLNELLLADESLTEDFREKAGVIFEAALNAKIEEKTAELEESYEVRLDEEVSSVKEDILSHVDEYMAYVVEQWMVENRLEVEAGLRTEVAEGFITGLKQLFVESYVEVPEAKVDLVDTLEKDLSEAKAAIEASEVKEAKQTALINDLFKDLAIREACEGLSISAAEKVVKLAENVEFTSAEDYTKKIDVLKESYLSASKRKVVIEEEEVKTLEESKDLTESNPAMAAYLGALAKIK